MDKNKSLIENKKSIFNKVINFGEKKLKIV